MSPADSPTAHRHLVLGGACSGKSTFAEGVALELGDGQATYIATAAGLDDEMRERIAHHQAQRDEAAWTVVEEETGLAGAINHAAPGSTVLIDCLTLWLSNCLHAQVWPDERRRFLDVLADTEHNVVLVSNEVGMGVVPLGELSREFVDESGRLHQDVAAACDEVTIVIAGLPQRLKP